MDVMKIARERREAMTDQVAQLKAEIAKIDEFMEMAEEIAAGKTVTAKSAPVETVGSKVTELSSNIFSAPTGDAKAS